MANLDRRGMAGSIYEGYHLTLLHTKYLSSVPYGFREEDFFSPYKSTRANEHLGMASLDPRGMVGRIYVGDQLRLLHTKYLSSGPISSHRLIKGKISKIFSETMSTWLTYLLCSNV